MKTITMKQCLLLIMVLKTTFSMGQSVLATDSIPQPIYDTTFNIRSTNSFYFCSKLFNIPRNCEDKSHLNCCSFSASIDKGSIIPYSGEISCSNGPALFWNVFENEDYAKEHFESNPSTMKKQMKKFKQEKIKLFVCDKEVSALRFDCTTREDYQFSEIVFYATINGNSIYGQLHLPTNTHSSKELTPLFQQIFRF